MVGLPVCGGRRVRQLVVVVMRTGEPLRTRLERMQ
jgi:hypothetical protein